MLGHFAGSTGTLGNLCGSRNVMIGWCARPTSSTTCNEVTICNGVLAARFQGNATGWSFLSDERDKRNITALPVGVDFLNDLSPRQFEWDNRESEVDQGKPAAGFIAQEVDAVVTQHNADYLNLVNKTNNERYSLTQTNLIPVLVKAIQELSAKNDALEDRIAQLEANG